MSSTVSSTNMGMPVPVVGVESGPAWSIDINACLAILDQHDHTTGNGVAISPSGLNINSDLTMASNNLTALRSVRFTAQGSPLGLAADLGCIYESGVDLYYNDGNGNQVRITQSGGVAGTAGSIGSLTSPASATYVAGSTKFVWQSAANTPANMDNGSVIIRNIVANSKGLTLDPPAAMGSDYTITLPALPASQKIMTLDASGNMTAPYSVDGTTIAISGNVISTGTATTTALVQTGSIVPYGGTSAPTGFLLCNGAAISRTTYAALFALIGTTFGVGDGSTTFNLPNGAGSDLATGAVTCTYPSGFGTTSSSVTLASRKGNDFHCRGTVLLGTVTSGTAQIILPSGVTIDSTKMAGSGTDALGLCYRGKTAALYPSASFGPFAIYWNGVDTDRVNITSSGVAGGFTTNGASSIFSTGDRIMFDFNVAVNILGSSIIKT